MSSKRAAPHLLDFDPEGGLLAPGTSTSGSSRCSKRSRKHTKTKSKSTTKSWRRKGSANNNTSDATSNGSPIRVSKSKSVRSPASSSHRSGKRSGGDRTGGVSGKSKSKRSHRSRGSRSSRRSRGSKKSQKLGCKKRKKTTDAAIEEGEGSQNKSAKDKADDRFLRRVFLDKLTADISESDIREEFGKFGELEEVARFRHKSNPSMYYAFVVYETAQACFRATKNPKPSIHGHTFDCYLAAIGEKYSGHKFFKEMKPKMRKKPYGGQMGSMHRKGGGRGGSRGSGDSRMTGMHPSPMESTVGLPGNALFYRDSGGISDGSMQGARMLSQMAGGGGSYGSQLSVAATAGSAAMTRSQSCQSLKHGYPSVGEMHRIDSRSSMHSVDSVRSNGYMSPRDYSPMYSSADRRSGMVPPVRLPRSGSGPILGEMRSQRYPPSTMDGPIAGPGMAGGHPSYYPSSMHTVHSAEYVPSAVAGSSGHVSRPPPAFQPGGIHHYSSGSQYNPMMHSPRYQQHSPPQMTHPHYNPGYQGGSHATRYRTGSHPGPHPGQMTRVHTGEYLARHHGYYAEGRPGPGYGAEPPAYVKTVSEPRSMIPSGPGVLRYPYPAPIETGMPIITMPPPGQSPDPDLYTEVQSSDDESLLNQLERFGLDEHFDDKALIDLSL